MAMVQNDPWSVFLYECQMYVETREALHRAPEDHGREQVLYNALVESALLHTRILAEIILSRGTESDAIRLEQLIPAWQRADRLAELVATLKREYGNRRTVDSPCWILNKMLAHPTLWRGDSYNYEAVFAKLDPIITDALREIGMITSTNDIRHFAGILRAMARKNAADAI